MVTAAVRRWTRLVACALAFALPAQVGAQQDRRAPVLVTPVREQAIQQLLQLTGTVTAARSARLSVATSGLVTGLSVDAGDRVAAAMR